MEYRNGHAEVRRSRRLVLSFVATVVNYEYCFYWHFYQVRRNSDCLQLLQSVPSVQALLQLQLCPLWPPSSTIKYCFNCMSYQASQDSRFASFWCVFQFHPLPQLTFVGQ